MGVVIFLASLRASSFVTGAGRRGYRPSDLDTARAAANNGDWAEAQSLRLEAYTTYDPELEARLMPRDPALATRIEQLLLDGVDQPGVKVLLLSS